MLRYLIHNWVVAVRASRTASGNDGTPLSPPRVGMPVIVITEQPEILVQNNLMEHGSYAIQMGRQFRLYVSRSP